MAGDISSGYVAATNLQNENAGSLPIFNVERVQLQFAVSSDFVAAQVANNVLIVALSTGRILRIDLDNAADIDDIDLPKKTSETGVIRRLFLDPSASHLIIGTTLGDNYYLHTQSRQPKLLSRLKSVLIESIAWNPSLPTASTREILIGAADGTIYETFIEPSNEFYKREEKYTKQIRVGNDGSITGLWIDNIPGRLDYRRIFVATHSKLLHYVGRLGRHAHEGGGPIFQKLLESETPTINEDPRPSGNAPSTLTVSPYTEDGAVEDEPMEKPFAWLSSQGIFHGSVKRAQDSGRFFGESKLLVRSKIPPSQTAGGRNRAAQDPISSVILSQWHMLCLVEGRIVAVNRLDDSIVYDQVVLEPGQGALGLVSDTTKNTYWLFTTQEIFEIVVNDEDREVWRIMLENRQFDAASHFAKTPAQKDVVASAAGDHLVSKKQYMEAATVYGRSTKAFEEVALTFIDEGAHDALRKYLLTKLQTLKKSATMQRIMVSSWLVELYMAKLNSLDDTITTKAEISAEANGNTASSETDTQLATTRKEFQDFASRYKSDLDRKTTYEIISGHGREEELLYFATVVDDFNYVLAYWVQRERWSESLNALKRQTDPDIFYKYSSVLMAQAAPEFVDILMRQANLDPEKLIPALLNYSKLNQVSLKENQAIRYLLFCINSLSSNAPAIHNTLISTYASSSTRDESPLLSYLESQAYANAGRDPSSLPYDADFALRLCIQHSRIRSAVHIYSAQDQPLRAIELALEHNEIDLAASIADRPDTFSTTSSASSSPALRKKLWLAIAKKVIGTGGIKSAIDFLRRSNDSITSSTPSNSTTQPQLLRIEDLLPLLPDFVLIDSLKEPITAALRSYTHQISSLRAEMDASASTSARVKSQLRSLDKRYAIVEPGESCRACGLPLLMRMFWTFPCLHGWHGDCLAKRVVEWGGVAKARRVRELQRELEGLAGGSAGVSGARGERRESVQRELEKLVAGACPLCSEMAVRRIDEPFVTERDDVGEWAL
ncbi:MAG: hypothetical protein M1820_010774 [Bogoriella megaspora]|nr:MAG: hypothetical protein M1820_010774 [Bogoriella megaspora]